MNLAAGAYRVRAGATSAGRRLGEGVGVFVVESGSSELRRSAPRPELLEAIANHTDGRHLYAQQSSLLDLRLKDPKVIEVDRRRNIDIWDNAWALAAGVVVVPAIMMLLVGEKEPNHRPG